jgi:hypothetical protein
VHADDDFVLCEIVNAVKKSVEALSEDVKEVSVKVSVPNHPNAE